MPTRLRVAAIVPAYNEAANIIPVLLTLMAHPRLSEVLVVDDGSVDETAAVARGTGARVIRLEQNVGKGGAMCEGARHTDAEILLYIDADLVGLSSEHIDLLLAPLLDEGADMSVGLFDEGRAATDLAQRLAPFLSGQRALHCRVIEGAPGLAETRYGVEVALEKYARQAQLRVSKVRLCHVAQVMKEQKRGVVKGFAARVKMYWEILRAAR